MVFYKLMSEEKFNGKNDKAEDEEEQADAINTVHVFDKPCFRTVRIGFFNVKIFRYLL